MTSNAFRALLRICACVTGISLLSSGVVGAGAYNPCKVPPVVSSAARPNAMIVMDFSGSMQFPAYFGKWDDSFGGYHSSNVAYQSTYYWQNDTATYDPSFLYYGSFDSDTYYVYDSTGNFFKAAETQPVKSYTGTAETGDINSTGGVSGNVLNLAVTSRTDAALQALIGGKATTVSGDTSNVYIQAQGARRHVTESTNVNAAFYVRPATLDSSAYYPDDYSSGSYGTKDTFVTITGQYSGKIDDKDPYYGTGSSGTVAVPCRKSFVVLISDGNWNGSVDPVKPAREMHVGVVGGATGDLRTDATLSGNQTVDVYSIFAFSDSEQGDNAMKAVGMYGSFEDATGCGNDTWPYPTSGYPASSLTFTWPVAQCNKDATACNPPGSCSSTPYYNVTCCKEWNSEWDRDNDGIDENKGSPASYYKASNGKQLQTALAAVFADVTSRHASASAVATVSQELSEGDLIVRGVFEAADPDKVDSYLWRGHLEAYTPFTYNNDKIYSFELADNQGLLCMEMAESQRHCFDAGYILSTTTDLAAWKVFTFDPDAKTQQDFDTSNTWLTNSIDGSADGVNRLGYLATSRSANTQNLINWIRGSYDASWNLRDRSGWDTAGTKPWRLGDVVCSTPVVVGPPGLGEVSLRDPDIKKFYTHRNNNIHRMKVVYVGANEGMLHAVVLGKYDEANDKWIYDPDDDGDGEIGKELWAYIPSNLLTELRPESDGTGGLANTDYGQGGCVHRTTVDLSPRSWEAYINPTANRPDLSDNPCGDEADSNGRCWRTVLVGGERGGGDVYFAIDVTDPRNPIALWECAVLKNRVVVEVASSSGDTTCIDECKADCASTSNDCRTDKNTCYNTCPQCERKWDRRWGWYNDCTARDSCRGECDTTYNTW